MVETRHARAGQAGPAIVTIQRRAVGGLVVLGLLGGCAAEKQATQPVWVAERGLVYCYETLAAPDCQLVPEPGAAERLIAVGPQVSYRPVVPRADRVAGAAPGGSTVVDGDGASGPGGAQAGWEEGVGDDLPQGRPTVLFSQSSM
jgi:hypothetical protein